MCPFNCQVGLFHRIITLRSLIWSTDIRPVQSATSNVRSDLNYRHYNIRRPELARDNTDCKQSRWIELVYSQHTWLSYRTETSLDFRARSIHLENRYNSFLKPSNMDSIHAAKRFIFPKLTTTGLKLCADNKLQPTTSLSRDKVLRRLKRYLRYRTFEISMSRSKPLATSSSV